MMKGCKIVEKNFKLMDYGVIGLFIWNIVFLLCIKNCVWFLDLFVVLDDFIVSGKLDLRYCCVVVLL